MTASGTFYIVGVGPGDPELLTIKGARILQECDVWLTPVAKVNGHSTALSIAQQIVAIDKKQIISHHFPMVQVHRGKEPEPEVLAAWKQAAIVVANKLSQGVDVAFPTLGDPAVYSTAFYVCEALANEGVDVAVEVIPGVSAIGASAAAAVMPLCLGDEHLVVIPATFDDSRIKAILAMCDSVAFMKVHRVMPRLVTLLEECNLVDKAVLIEKTSFSDQRIWKDIREAASSKIHYFSTMIVRK